MTELKAKLGRPVRRAVNATVHASGAKNSFVVDTLGGFYVVDQLYGATASRVAGAVHDATLSGDVSYSGGRWFDFMIRKSLAAREPDDERA